MRTAKKFRAWDEDGHMIYPPFGMLILPDGRPMILEPDGTLGTSGSAIELMQSTGYEDKNGVEIYEGDIIEASGETIGEVVYDQFSYIIMSPDHETLIVPTIHEVIGSIYENPELAPWRNK